MKFNQLAPLFACMALTLETSATHADSATAQCEMWHKGDHKRDATGTCQFSQRQGYIDIRLHDGSNWSLSPGDKSDHFRDQQGHKVKRHMEDGKQVYKWDHRKITVAFGGNHGRGHGSSGHDDVRTPRDLKDLIGQSGGHAEDKLRSRGYTLAGSSTSGRDQYSNWKHRHGGQCVTVHSINGHYQSIVYAPQFDCQ